MKVTVSRSVAVAVPIEVTFSSIINTDGEVITGSTVSTTFTVLVAVPALPEASVDVYVTVYAPTVSVSTVPVVTLLQCLRDQLL